MKKKTIVLMRLSNEIQGFESQRNAINQYAKENNIVIDEWFKECGTKIKEMAKDGELEQVIVVSIDRISRRTLEVRGYIDYLNKYGVRVLSVEEGCLDNRKSFELKNFIKMFEENDYENTEDVERISEGKKIAK